MKEQQVTKPTDFDLMFLKFADAKIPVFKESKSKDFILYGEENNYPEYLTELFNKSAKHNAIVNGKAFYIFGQGFINGDFTVNRLGESLNDVVKKATLDIPLFGGLRFEVVYNALGKICEIYHGNYARLRKSKEGGWLYSDSWGRFTKEWTPIPSFNPSKPNETQIFSYDEYRPNSEYYPLPDYIGALNYIETDIEISKYYLSAIKNGMMPSKLIEFFSGEPTEDKKKEIERRFKQKFTGSENAGNIILSFNKDKGSPIQINDLSSSDLDKQFIELNKTVQQEIFSGHLITSPMLFGIKTEGQLGGNTELKTSYELFKNTYSKPKADAISKEISYLLSYSIWPGYYELEPTEPVGNQIDIKDVLDIVPQTYIFKQLGIPQEDITQTQPGTPVAVNENVKNLTGRQQQQLERLIRKYKKGQLDEAQTRLLLKSGLGFNDDEVNTMLGIQPVQQPIAQQMSKEFSEDEIIGMFDSCGDAKDDFEIIKSKRVGFALQDIESDESIYIHEAFKTYDVTYTEGKIIELIKKDPLITPEVIARTIGQSTALVESKINSLVARGYLEETATLVGEGELTNTVVSRTIPEKVQLPPAKIDGAPMTKISIKYSYEGPQDSRNRPFCARMLQLNRLYTRADIERISARLGYSVWDRRGGFWTRKGTNDTTPYCRHKWQSNIVVQKGA